VLAVVLVFAVAALTGGDQKPKIAATVDGTTISMQRVDALIRHAQREAQREGKHFPPKGSDEYKLLQRQALDLIVYHEELEQSAGSLGITVTEQQLEAGGRGLRESEAGGVANDPGEETFWRESFRGQLLYRRIFQRLTRGIRASDREIRADYRARADLYRLQGRSFAQARRSIKANLISTKRNAAMARWVARMRRTFESKITYAAQFHA
jgi:hypothetical protein